MTRTDFRPEFSEDALLDWWANRQVLGDSIYVDIGVPADIVIDSNREQIRAFLTRLVIGDHLRWPEMKFWTVRTGSVFVPGFSYISNSITFRVEGNIANLIEQIKEDRRDVDSSDRPCSADFCPNMISRNLAADPEVIYCGRRDCARELKD